MSTPGGPSQKWQSKIDSRFDKLCALASNEYELANGKDGAEGDTRESVLPSPSLSTRPSSTCSTLSVSCQPHAPSSIPSSSRKAAAAAALITSSPPPRSPSPTERPPTPGSPRVPTPPMSHAVAPMVNNSSHELRPMLDSTFLHHEQPVEYAMSHQSMNNLMAASAYASCKVEETRFRASRKAGRPPKKNISSDHWSQGPSPTLSSCAYSSNESEKTKSTMSNMHTNGDHLTKTMLYQDMRHPMANHQQTYMASNGRVFAHPGQNEQNSSFGAHPYGMCAVT